MASRLFMACHPEAGFIEIVEAPGVIGAIEDPRLRAAPIGTWLTCDGDDGERGVLCAERESSGWLLHAGAATCGNKKPLDDFYRLHKDGEARQSRCKTCDNEVRARGVRVVRGLLQAGGAAHALDLQREQERRGTGHRVLRDHQAGEGPGAEVDEPEDERETLLLRGLSRTEQLDSERFARTAATLVLVGWRPLDAWSRANELLDDGDPLPALFADAPTTVRRPVLVTPPERLREPPKSVEHMIPRERPGIEFHEEIAETPLDADAPPFEMPQAPPTDIPASPPRGPGRPPGSSRTVAAPAPPAPPAPKERLCAGCTHPEEWHSTGVCYHCGCEKFRPIKTAADRRAEDAALDAILEKRAAEREAKRAAEEAEHAIGRCPALGARGRACGRPGIHAGFCVVHAQRRGRGVEVPIADAAPPEAPREVSSGRAPTPRPGRAPSRAASGGVVHRDLKPENVTSTKESPMAELKISARERVVEVLQSGPKTSKEIVEALGDLAAGNVTGALSALRAAGVVTKTEGYGGTWSLANGAAKTMADVAKKAAKRTAPAKKTNGHAAPAPAPAATGGTKGALLALMQSMQASHERKMGALQVLLEDE